MVKLNLELDDATYAALLRAAEQSGIDIRRLQDAAVHVSEQSEIPNGREFESWDEFFRWIESFKLDVKGNLATREEIYDR